MPRAVLCSASSVAVAAFFVACSTASHSDVRREHTHPETGSLIEYVWRSHERVVLSVLNTEQGEIDLDRLSESVVFFEELTGITSDSHTYFGVLPTPELPDTLARWNRWYAENRHSLRIDPLSCQLEVISVNRRPVVDIGQP